MTPLRVGLAFSLACSTVALADSAPSESEAKRKDIETVTIIGVAPAPGLGEPLERVPANVQQLTDEDLRRTGATNATEAFERRLGSVHDAQTADNPFQPDLTYRGFVASPLLGTPSGLSVYQDGVRLNELLGDNVNWDLIPLDAIASAEIVPGAEPLYGRNTLGGAFALETKRGLTHPGTSAEAYGGSFGRRRVLAETGGTGGPFDYFALGNLFEEDGFRDFSDSEVAQLFGEVGWHDADTDVRATYTADRNELRGGGFAPDSLLARDRSAVFTHPDVFRPDLDFVEILGRRALAAGMAASFDAFYRDLTVRQLNGDAADDSSGDDDAGTTNLSGVNRRTRTHQRTFGGAAQAVYGRRLLGAENDLAFGVQGDGGSADLRLAEQRGFLDASRGVVATEPFGQPRTHVSVDENDFGVFTRDTLTPLSWTSLTVSARYDRNHLDITDHLGGRASGDHTFDRINPAVGVTVHPRGFPTFYARYGEAFRAPTAVELSCASEANPCPLPIVFAEDPSLKEVRAKSVEVGLRAELPAARFVVAAFRTELDDDILFVSRTRSLGFFQNVGETLRQGVESSLEGTIAGADWFASYSFTRATFETSETLASPVGANEVRPGDRIPGVPDHLVKAGFDSSLPYGFRFGLDLQYTGRQFIRTDESNRLPPLHGYVVVNASLRYTRGRFTLFARADNLFDAEYESFATRGENVFEGGRVERFSSPGAPIGGWFGLRVQL